MNRVTEAGGIILFIELLLQQEICCIMNHPTFQQEYNYECREPARIIINVEFRSKYQAKSDR